MTQAIFQGEASASPPFGSVYAMGLSAKAASDEFNRLDRQSVERGGLDRNKPDVERALNLADDRRWALWNLCALFRAGNLQDATAQLVVAFDTIGRLEGSEGSENFKEKLRTLRRIVLSCLSVVAAAADVNLADIDNEYLIGLVEREFSIGDAA